MFRLGVSQITWLTGVLCQQGTQQLDLLAVRQGVPPFPLLRFRRGRYCPASSANTATPVGMASAHRVVIVQPCRSPSAARFTDPCLSQ